MSHALPLNRCRMCGATSYRQVVERDGAGAMRATGLYRCSGCSVVFADPRAWREGGPEEAMPPEPPAIAGHGGIPASTVRDDSLPATPRAPDWRTYGTVPGAAKG